MFRDCTHPLTPATTVYPGDPTFERTPHATHDEDGYCVTRLELGTHSGTHVDAPSHTEPDGRTLDSFPVETFAFDALRIDVRDKAPREPIERADLPDPTDDELLVFHTGWDDHWGTDAYFDHPYLTADAAAWCADRDYHVAIDALNVDPTPTENARDDEPDGVPAHHELLGADHLIVENLTNLDGLPRRFRLSAFPLAVEDADGAPIRAVAEFWGEENVARRTDEPTD
ncbi:cyclase family protein [Haladaptatus paucihalophilus DX253]|uniref:Cyclase family protein n=1 Tax=Haladaptatus paucihalophilus DX253 TaxID=797209 RepID=E7QR79_HALPU|nr:MULTISPECIES: cyclase family protein [Haladaptatus]EFW92987.1 cyclase family protein [Haladaptatus paucihalophilus DX253]GKZ15780.1 cyclase [Haladaptatus sp. T7]SHL17472.1 Kynurenine formamidase [Haladaptatus paucihalophilus DX253]